MTLCRVRAPAESGVLLVQFAKWPEAGKVKTRLIPALGQEGALAAHVSLSQQVLANLQATCYRVEFWWDRERPVHVEQNEPLTSTLGKTGAVQRVQVEGDLGYRMLCALNDGLARFPAVIIVGSDCPSVDPAYLHQAITALETTDLVLGPAEDGGFVLIGARRTVPDMFRDVSWGTDQALRHSLAQFERVGLSASVLEQRWDVDELDDWRRFLAECAGTST